MTQFFRWSLSAYRSLLTFYPDDLRRDFGPEMLDAFAQDLSVECAARSIKGAIRVWRTTLRELFRIAFPAWLHLPAVAVPALSAAIFVISESPLLIATFRRASGDPSPADALLGISIGAVTTALTSFVAVYQRKRASLISLGIRRPRIG